MINKMPIVISMFILQYVRRPTARGPYGSDNNGILSKLIHFTILFQEMQEQIRNFLKLFLQILTKRGGRCIIYLCLFFGRQGPPRRKTQKNRSSDFIKVNTEGYRSGHNEAVLKTVWEQSHVGSNPTPSAIAKALLLWGFFHTLSKYFFQIFFLPIY